MKNLLFLICSAAIFLVNTTLACTLVSKSLAEFDETEYIFIGKIVAYTQPVESAKLGGKAFGLVVKVKESVYLPRTPKEYFEVFPIQLWSDCSQSGTAIETLQKGFSLNSEIRVIAKESEYLPNNLSDGNIRLEDRPNEIGSIVLNNDKNNRTSANSGFDYKSYECDINNCSDSNYLLPEFEARKDLLRLRNSKNQMEKNEILARMLYFPIGHSADIYEIFKKYSESKKAYENLYCKRLLEIEGLSDDEFNFLKPNLPKVCSQYKNKG